ncbi:MAG: hypothetical protein AAGM22_00190 [Acidobacteriota bacterium]
MTSLKGTKVAMIRTISLLVAFAAIPAFAYTPPSQQQLDLSAESFQLRDGVVADPARSAVYVMTRAGVQAIDVEGGDTLWTTDAAQRPVGLYGDQLVALATPEAAGRLKLALLDVRTGQVVTTISAGLPEGVSATVVDGPGRQFQAGLNVAGGAFFQWRSVGRPLVGAPVVAGELPSVQQVQEGVLQLNPAAGEATAVDRAAAPKPPAFRFDLAADEQLAGVQGRQFRAGDDRHVLATEKRSGSDGFNRYRWTLHDRVGGAIGSVDRPVSTAPFFVSGATLVHEAGPVLRRLDTGDFETKGLRLVAADLRSGVELWSVDLRDTAYRGVLPP